MPWYSLTSLTLTYTRVGKENSWVSFEIVFLIFSSLWPPIAPWSLRGAKKMKWRYSGKKKTKPGFYLQEIDRHFVGATTSELYEALFEIEEKDETYLKYAALYPFREEIQKGIEKYENKKKSDPDREEGFQMLYRKEQSFQNAKDHSK